MEIKIEKGVEIPRGHDGGITRIAHAMEVGDSFLYPKDKRNALMAAFYRIPGRKYATRSVDAENIRVWRIK